jgi:hypothetical protein
MGQFYCPYLGRDADERDGSIEDIVPKSLGGSVHLSIRVERKANNDLGSGVDAPVTKVYAYRRTMLDLRGRSGRQPTFSIPVSVRGLDGHSATWEVGPNSATVRLKPKVEMTAQSDGTRRVSISGDPAEARRIAEDMRKAHEAKGRVVVPFTESPQTLEKPEVTGTFEFDLVALGRFNVKVALGIGHWLWGERWSRGKDATILRQALWSTTIDELNANAPENLSIAPGDLGLRARPDEHAFLVCPGPGKGQGCALGLLLFGQPGRVIRLVAPGGEPGDVELTLVLLEVKTGGLQRLSVMEMMSEKRFEGVRDVP